MNRRKFVAGCAAMLGLGLIGVDPNTHGWAEEYVKACREADVPMEERGDVCVLVVNGKATRFEDVKKDDRFKVIFPKGYERHSDGEPMKWIADCDAERVDGPECGRMIATKVEQRADVQS